MASEEDGRPVNLGNPDEQPMIALAERIIRLAGSSSELTFEPLPENDPVRRKPDITRAREILGWSPRVSIDVGLGRTIAFFHSRLTAIH
jgi:nucleoside-diphosphate-sugar epimerase